MDLKLLAQNTACKIFSNLSDSIEHRRFDDVHEIILSSYERLYIQARKDQVQKVNVIESSDGSLHFPDN